MPDSRSHLVAWSAGFLDGEGWLGVRKNGLRSRIPCISVGQNERLPLERLQELFDGHIYLCTRKVRDQKRPFHTWELNGGIMLRKALPELIPHLVGKKRQAELLLEYASRQGKRGGPRLSHDEIASRLLLEQEISALKRM